LNRIVNDLQTLKARAGGNPIEDKAIDQYSIDASWRING
jgi:hypothetical protein